MCNYESEFIAFDPERPELICVRSLSEISASVLRVLSQNYYASRHNTEAK